MKHWKKIIFGLALTPIVLCVLFYIYFAIGMIDTSSRKPIDSNIVSECNEDLKSSNKDLKNVELYYYQGKIFVNVNFEKSLSLDESKIAIKSLKEFILKANISSFFSRRYEEMPILAIMQSKDNSYYYKCPYYLMTDQKLDSDVKSYYKIWYLTDSDGDIIEKINID